jgi:hypothetical protein
MITKYLNFAKNILKDSRREIAQGRCYFTNVCYWNIKFKQITHVNVTSKAAGDSFKIGGVDNYNDNIFPKKGLGVYPVTKREKIILGEESINLKLLVSDINDIVPQLGIDLKILRIGIETKTISKYDKSRKGSYVSSQYLTSYIYFTELGPKGKVPQDIYENYKSYIINALKKKRSKYLSQYDIDPNSEFYKIIDFKNADDCMYFGIGIGFNVDYCSGCNDRYCNAFHSKRHVSNQT